MKHVLSILAVLGILAGSGGCKKSTPQITGDWELTGMYDSIGPGYLLTTPQTHFNSAVEKYNPVTDTITQALVTDSGIIVTSYYFTARLNIKTDGTAIVTQVAENQGSIQTTIYTGSWNMMNSATSNSAIHFAGGLDDSFLPSTPYNQCIFEIGGLTEEKLTLTASANSTLAFSR